MATVAHLRVIEGERRAPPVPDPSDQILYWAGWDACVRAYEAGLRPSLRLVPAGAAPGQADESIRTVTR